MAIHELRAESAHVHSDFFQLFQAYSIARGRHHIACNDGSPDEVTSDSAEVYSNALEALMLAPAGSVTDLAHKLEAFQAEQLCDGWKRAPIYIAAMLADAQALKYQ